MVLVPTKDRDKCYSKKRGEKSSIFTPWVVFPFQTMEGSHQGKYRWPGCTVVAFRFLVKHISQATIFAERERKKRDHINQNFSGMKVETWVFWGPEVQRGTVVFVQCWGCAFRRGGQTRRLKAGPVCLRTTWGSAGADGPPPLGPPHLDPAKGQGFSCLGPVQARVIKGDTLFNSWVTGWPFFFFF